MSRYQSSRGGSRARSSRGGGRAPAGRARSTRAPARGGGYGQARGGSRRPPPSNNNALMIVSILAVVGVIAVIVIASGGKDEGTRRAPPPAETGPVAGPSNAGPSKLPAPTLSASMMKAGERSAKEMEDLYEEANELYQESLQAKERGASRSELDELMGEARRKLHEARDIYNEWEGRPGLPTNKDWSEIDVIDKYFFSSIIRKVQDLLSKVGSKASGGGAGD